MPAPTTAAVAVVAFAVLTSDDSASVQAPMPRRDSSITGVALVEETSGREGGVGVVLVFCVTVEEGLVVSAPEEERPKQAFIEGQVIDMKQEMLGRTFGRVLVFGCVG